MGCVFLEEATDQPPPQRMLALHLDSGDAFKCLHLFLELSVGMECVHIYHLAIQVCKLKPL